MKKQKKRDLYNEIRKSYLVFKVDGVTVDTVKTVENIQLHTAEIVQAVNAAGPEDRKKLIVDLMCFNHTDKMRGLVSLSTCCKTNKFCAERAKIKGSICEKCYAMRQFERFANQFIKNAIAGVILTGCALTLEDMPFINAAFIRLESFGDIENAQQVKNYALFCKANKHAHIALWTKNAGIVCRVFREKIKKPENLICIYSALFVDTPENEKFENMRDVFNKQFTVYKNEKSAAAAGVKINCGGRNCAGCLKCYKKNNVVQIAELLK